MKNYRFKAFLSRGSRKVKFHYVPMARRKDLCPLLIVYFEDRVQGFPKRILLYILNAWFGEKSKMVILGKIVKQRDHISIIKDFNESAILH
jgi:hypothetical protein